MNAKVPFEEYHFRLYRTIQPITVRAFELHSLSENIEEIPLSDNQQSFLQTLLKLQGVIRITITVNDIIVYKWPGYIWDTIEPIIVQHIQSCTISENDLKIQTRLIIKSFQ